MYVMTVGKSGPKPKLLEWKPGQPAPRADPPPPGVYGNLGYRGNMRDFAELTLSRLKAVGRPVLDKTGLMGDYSFTVFWYQDENFLIAVQDQLGLKFEALKEPMDAVVVDHIEKPDAN